MVVVVRQNEAEMRIGIDDNMTIRIIRLSFIVWGNIKMVTDIDEVENGYLKGCNSEYNYFLHTEFIDGVMVYSIGIFVERSTLFFHFIGVIDAYNIVVRIGLGQAKKRIWWLQT